MSEPITRDAAYENHQKALLLVKQAINILLRQSKDHAAVPHLEVAECFLQRAILFEDIERLEKPQA